MLKITEISSQDRLASFARGTDQRRQEILAVLTILKARRTDAGTDPRVMGLEGFIAGCELLKAIVATADGASKAA